MKNSLNIKIAGSAGEGIKSVGLVLSKSFVRAGYYTFDYTEYPSLIRGGHNTYQTHIGTSPVYSQVKNLDILIALNKETINLHQDELTENSLIIYDPDKVSFDESANLKGKYIAIPLVKLAVAAGGKPLMANNVALGAVMYLAGLDTEILKGVIGEIFAHKGQEIIEPNQKAADSGFEYANKNYSNEILKLDKPTAVEEKILLTGNEAIAVSAISSGMKFYAAYPMTPATSILHYLASKAKQYNLLVKHAEDEISVINMALGASFAGVRTMIATSGGGFSLMSEALGMAGIMELPIVIVEGMRAGPSSGMPTWHDQGDLFFALYTSQGEFPRMVFTPGDIEENFLFTQKAFYFAEKYQLPVIILTDKYMAESPMSVKSFQKDWDNKRYSFVADHDNSQNYKRYQITESGISPRSLPSQQNLVYLTNSYEHDENGFATEQIKERNQQVEKRKRKFENLILEAESIKQPVFGNPQSEIGIISWGSNKGPIREALKSLGDKEISYLHLNLVCPFPKKQVTSFLEGKKRVFCIECNSNGQLTKLIRQETGHEIKNKLLKYDGRPFYPEEIIEKVRNLKNE